jgi:hypothetical protein
MQITKRYITVYYLLNLVLFITVGFVGDRYTNQSAIFQIIMFAGILVNILFGFLLLRGKDR